MYMNLDYLKSSLKYCQGRNRRVIIFPELDEGIEELKYHAEGSSENYELDFKPFVFDVDIK